MWGGWGMRWWCERWEETWLCSLGVAEPWPRRKLLRVEYSDSLPLPDRESAPPPSPTPPEGDFSPPPTVLPGPLLRRRSPSLLVEPLLLLPVVWQSTFFNLNHNIYLMYLFCSTSIAKKTHIHQCCAVSLKIQKHDFAVYVSLLFLRVTNKSILQSFYRTSQVNI